MKNIEDLGPNWKCPKCGNDRVNGTVEFREKNGANVVVYRCSQCGKKVAENIL